MSHAADLAAYPDAGDVEMSKSDKTEQTPEALIAETRALCERATRGPWKVNRMDLDSGWINYQVQQDRPPGEVISNTSDDEVLAARHTADLIARARTLLPALADALEAARLEIRIREDGIGSAKEDLEIARAELTALRAPVDVEAEVAALGHAAHRASGSLYDQCERGVCSTLRPHIERAARLARENEALRAEIERLKKEADDVRRAVDAAQDGRGRP